MTTFYGELECPDCGTTVAPGASHLCLKGEIKPPAYRTCPDCKTGYLAGKAHYCPDEGGGGGAPCQVAPPTPPPLDPIAAILADRGKTHGKFGDHARVTQALKSVLLDEHAARAARGQPHLTDEQTEALDMICHKIGRILAGEAGFADHWDDIAGYARLCGSNRT